MRVRVLTLVAMLAALALIASAQTKILRVPVSVMGRLQVVHVEPIYPLDARQAGVSGIVKLDVVVDVNGKVASAQPMSGPKMLYAAAVNAVRRWEYKPYKRNGVATQVETTVMVDFSLKSTLSGQVLPS